jgi:hypothetical protein
MPDKPSARAISALRRVLAPYEVQVMTGNDRLKFIKKESSAIFRIAGETFGFISKPGEAILPADYLIRSPEKVAALALTRLGLNKRVFARSCEVRKVDKPGAEKFHNAYHLMDHGGGAYHRGLFHKEELLALASFSKGRKMDRLAPGKLSFELVRFCSRTGVTVTGGLSKLVKSFCREKAAGDVMTYVDTLLYDGSSFERAGFRPLGTREFNYFLIDKATYGRTAVKDRVPGYNPEKYYLTRNEGGIKMVFGCEERRTSFDMAP